LSTPIRAYRDVQSYEDAKTIPGLVVYRFDAPLFFANADVFPNQILELVDVTAEPVVDDAVEDHIARSALF
jgi:SulP family sulfate permease